MNKNIVRISFKFGDKEEAVNLTKNIAKKIDSNLLYDLYETAMVRIGVKELYNYQIEDNKLKERMKKVLTKKEFTDVYETR